jgi:hypothetical protein
MFEASRSHTITHPVGLFRTSEEPVADAVPIQHATYTKEEHPRLQRDSNPRSQQPSGLRPKPTHCLGFLNLCLRPCYASIRRQRKRPL